MVVLVEVASSRSIGNGTGGGVAGCGGAGFGGGDSRRASLRVKRWVQSLATGFVIGVVLCAACSTEQPPSARTVAAYAVPLPTMAERVEFIALLKRLAAMEPDVHVDFSTDAELSGTAEVIPAARRSISVGVWRRSNDEEILASAMDAADHLGLAWIAFFRGVDPGFSTRFRDRAVAEIKMRWPATASLPIAPTGAIPLARDLRLVGMQYLVEPSEAAQYEIDVHSPLLAPAESH
jgi:hypothetical protein